MCRYGRITLQDAMNMPRKDTDAFVEAVGTLISEENNVTER